MTKIDRSKQIEAVRNFCKALPDGKEFTICVLLMKGMPEKKIRRRMHMKMDAWEEMKETIRQSLAEVPHGLNLFAAVDSFHVL